MLTLLPLFLACGPETQNPGAMRPGGTDTPADTAVETLPDDTAAPGGDVRINEVMADNDRTLEDGDGDSPDWVELFAVEAVDLEGWGLTDEADEPFRYTFPALRLQAGELLVLYASGKGANGPPGELHMSRPSDFHWSRLTTSYQRILRLS